MSEQYFAAKPQSASQVSQFEARLRERTLSFEVDRGVFSRGGIDFGSRLLIEAIQLLPGDWVLDLGCGYGAVGVALAASNVASRIMMVDVNERAVLCAQKNAARNGVAKQVETVQSDGVAALAPEVHFSVIAINPPIRAGKETVYRLLAQAAQKLTAQGRLYVVIQKKQGADSALRYLRDLSLRVDTIAKEGGYRVYLCSPIQKEG